MVQGNVWFSYKCGVTKVIKIGAGKARRLTWEGHFSLEWTSTFEVLGIVLDLEYTNNITHIRKISKINAMTRIIKDLGCMVFNIVWIG